jgi:hypothetical protein
VSYSTKDPNLVVTIPRAMFTVGQNRYRPKLKNIAIGRAADRIHEFAAQYLKRGRKNHVSTSKSLLFVANLPHPAVNLSKMWRRSGLGKPG